MIVYLKTLEIYDKTKLALFFADTAEDLSASASHPGISYDEIAPGSKCTTANGDKYLLNSSKEWIKIESGSSPSPTPTPSEHILEITPVLGEGGTITDQESIDILNELEDNYLNGDCSYVLKVSYDLPFPGGGSYPYHGVFRSFCVLSDGSNTMAATSVAQVGDTAFYIAHERYESTGTDMWTTQPYFPI